MGMWDILFLVAIIILVLGIAFYFLNKWASKKSSEQHNMVEAHKQTVSLYIIDKKKDKLTNANLPKAMVDQIPRMGKLMKMPLVKVKAGQQIMTMVCDKDVYDALPVKKTVSVEVAGAYIVGMKGMKTKLEMAAHRKLRRKGGESSDSASFLEKIKSRFKK